MKIKPYMEVLPFPDNMSNKKELGFLDKNGNTVEIYIGSGGSNQYEDEGILEWWVVSNWWDDKPLRPNQETEVKQFLNDYLRHHGVPEYEINWRNRYDKEDGDESDVFITLNPLPAEEEKLWKSYWENKRGDKSCSHENLSIKTMELDGLTNQLLLTIDCDKCGKRTSTSASLNQGWEAEDLNTWAQQELSSHGQNVSFKNWAKKEVKSHGNIDLVDWAKHEKQSHTKKYGVESFSLDSKKADSINMEEPVVEEPSFIPDGDGRAIGQQNSSINLSPLHAETFEATPKWECDACGDMHDDEDDAESCCIEDCDHTDSEMTSWGHAGQGSEFWMTCNNCGAEGYGTFNSINWEHDDKTLEHEQTAESFNAETIHEKGDYRIIAEEDYDVSTGGVFQEREDFDDLMELSDTHGMFTLMLQKKVMGGWETIDSVSGVVPHYGDMEDVVLKELNIPDGVNFDAESRFDKLSNEIADEYEEKGMSPEKAQEVGDATAAKIGRKKYGKKGMAQMSKKGMDAESEAATYSPSSSPDMVNEIQTSPTNESPQLFNASNTFNVTSALGISGLVVAALSLPMLYSSAKSRLGKSAEEQRKASGSVRRNHTQVKNSEYSVGQVNPVEAEGQQDIHGAEGITNPRHAPSASPAGYPSKTLKMW